MPSPTALTLTRLRQLGFVAGVVERFIPQVNRKRDFLGCIDLIAVHHARPGVLGIQATSIGHVGDRVKKAKGRPELRTWLAAGATFQAWGWAKRGDRWVVKVVEMRAGELDEVLVTGPPRRGRRPRPRGLFDALDPESASAGDRAADANVYVPASSRGEG